MEQNCPICMLHYDDINMLKCCKAMICTECYLQVENPDSRDSPCPFCKNDQMSIVVARRLCDNDVDRRTAEEQKVIEATIQAKNNAETATLQSSFNSENARAIQDTFEDLTVDILRHDNQYDTYGQTSGTSYDTVYEGYAEINESNFTTRNNENTSSENMNGANFNHLYSMDHLNTNDRGNDLQTASELFLSEIPEEHQVELAIQLSLMEAEGNPPQECFLF